MIEDLLVRMENYAKAHHVPIINERGKEVLINIVAKKKPRRVLEIGTAIGYSTLLIAQSSAADVWITTLELDEARAGMARAFIQESEFDGRIEILTGDASARLNELNGLYDLVFIDAAKGQYVHYFRQVVPLLACGGVIIADNVLFRGLVRTGGKPPRRYKTIVSRLREYIEMVEHHPMFDTVIYENGDGLAVSYHRGEQIEET